MKKPKPKSAAKPRKERLAYIPLAVPPRASYDELAAYAGELKSSLRIAEANFEESRKVQQGLNLVILDANAARDQAMIDAKFQKALLASSAEKRSELGQRIGRLNLLLFRITQKRFACFFLGGELQGEIDRALHLLNPPFKPEGRPTDSEIAEAAPGPKVNVEEFMKP